MTEVTSTLTHSKDQETITHNEINQLTKTNRELTQMLEFADKEIETVTIAVL